MYRGILGDSSLVFKDMFSLPQPAHDVSVDGCSVVQMSDSAEDWEYILKALYRRGYVSVQTIPLPMPIVTAFLRLGSKYNIEELHSEAITRLTHEFPSSFERYNGLKPLSMINKIHRFEIINLAREHDIPFILPTAMYFICMICSFDQICNGISQKEGDLVTLQPEDQKACLIGWLTLLERRRAALSCS